jgi:NADP-reducing hydrogenase subunit HndB
VHMGTCGIASGARDVMDGLLRAIEEANVSDVAVTTSGCMGLCSREPLVTVEIIDQEPIKYEYVDANKMRQIFKRHVLEGEIQLPFVLARGAEITK